MQRDFAFSLSPSLITALLHAMESRKVDMVKLLIKSGADVEVKDEDDLTPLMFVAKHANLDAVKLLIRANAPISVQEEDGGTAFDQIFT